MESSSTAATAATVAPAPAPPRFPFRADESEEGLQARRDAQRRYQKYYTCLAGEALDLYGTRAFSQGLDIIRLEKAHIQAVLLEQELLPETVPLLFQHLVNGYACLNLFWTDEELKEFYRRVLKIVESPQGASLPNRAILTAWSYIPLQHETSIEVLGLTKSKKNFKSKKKNFF